MNKKYEYILINIPDQKREIATFYKQTTLQEC